VPRFRLDQVITIFLIILALGLIGAKTGSSVVVPKTAAHPGLTLLKPAPVPVFTAGRELKLPTSDDLESWRESVAAVPTSAQAQELQWSYVSTLSAQAVYVMDVASAAPLLIKEPMQPLFPASTTKLLTALTALKTYPLDHYLTVKEEAFTQGTTMHLELGEQISVRELLYGLLISSGNDAAFVLANNHPEGYDGFVIAMNQLAQELHLDHTTFTNPSGLDHPGHHTSARDLAILSREVMKEPLLQEIVGTKIYTTTGPLGELRHELVNTHALLGVVPGVKGVKTGTTEGAGQVLITQVERENHEVLIVIMGSQDRYGETRRIIEWIWQNYTWLDLE
jgi:D-alanyl-D-alanine carboxypeptidase (penicillin-binding protein 5/6)